MKTNESDNFTDRAIRITKHYFLQIDLAIYLSSLILFLLYLNNIEIISMNDSMLQFNYVLFAISVAAAFIVQILYRSFKVNKNA